jgi:hypothetical protein
VRAAILIFCVFFAACRTYDRADQHPATTGASSPAGVRHPGTIVFVDKVEGTTWTKQASDVPQSIAWARLSGGWTPVVRVEITGTKGQREFFSFGPDGQFLESTFLAPPR